MCLKGTDVRKAKYWFRNLGTSTGGGCTYQMTCGASVQERVRCASDTDALEVILVLRRCSSYTSGRRGNAGFRDLVS